LLARSLQDAGIISYRRGSIEVIDPYALQQASCRCHTLRHAWTDFDRQPTPQQAVLNRVA
jgi:hypothetical protein